PTDAEAVLPCLLRLGGPVVPLPVFALGGEEQVTGAVGSEVRDRRVDQAVGIGEPVLRRREAPLAPAERLAVFHYRYGLVARDAGCVEAAGAVALDDPQADAVRLLDARPAHRRQRPGLD